MAGLTDDAIPVLPLLYVEWVDSLGVREGWELIAHLHEAPVPVLVSSIGWVLHETQTALTLVPHWARRPNVHAPSQGCGILTIPICAITLRTRLVDPGLDPTFTGGQP